MARTRYISNSRGGIEGSIIRGNVLYAPLGGRVGLGGVGQDIYEESTTQRYDIGTRLVTGDGRVFRYAYLGSAICYSMAGVHSWDAQFLGWTTVAAAQAIGDTSVTIANQNAAKDVLRGGYIMMGIDATDVNRMHRFITGNTYASSSTITITFERPLDHAIAADGVVEVLYSPYRNVYWTNDGNSSNIGVPAMCSTIGNYIWLQTWGPLTLSPGAATPDPGADAEQRQVQFDAAGNILCIEDGSGVARQEAGFIIQRDAGGAGCPFIMLQISP